MFNRANTQGKPIPRLKPVTFRTKIYKRLPLMTKVLSWRLPLTVPALDLAWQYFYYNMCYAPCAPITHNCVDYCGRDQRTITCYYNSEIFLLKTDIYNLSPEIHSIYVFFQWTHFHFGLFTLFGSFGKEGLHQGWGHFIIGIPDHVFMFLKAWTTGVRFQWNVH